MITINMNKAIDVSKDRIRAKRASVLEALDVQYIRALEANLKTKAKEIAAEKQRLRDLTNDEALNTAHNVDQLKAVEKFLTDSIGE
jgi:chromosome condensin MukBEF ATPase and DNA-binding subunit MukB